MIDFILTILALLFYLIVSLLINWFIAWIILSIGSLIFGYYVTFQLVWVCAVIMTLLRR
mgnify:CR=1 FL=1